MFATTVASNSYLQVRDGRLVRDLAYWYRLRLRAKGWADYQIDRRARVLMGMGLFSSDEVMLYMLEREADSYAQA